MQFQNISSNGFGVRYNFIRGLSYSSYRLIMEGLSYIIHGSTARLLVTGQQTRWITR